jgi:altronate dehydratase
VSNKEIPIQLSCIFQVFNAVLYALCAMRIFSLVVGGRMKENALLIHPRDNVAVALRTLKAEEQVMGTGLELFLVLDEIPASHKIALRDIPAGEEIIKYGETVAVSTRSIRKGEWVHTHNLESKRWKK